MLCRLIGRTQVFGTCYLGSNPSKASIAEWCNSSTPPSEGGDSGANPDLAAMPV